MPTHTRDMDSSARHTTGNLRTVTWRGAARRACAIRAQLVPVEKPADDDGAGDDSTGDDSKILSVSQVEDAAGQAIEAGGVMMKEVMG